MTTLTDQKPTTNRAVNFVTEEGRHRPMLITSVSSAPPVRSIQDQSEPRDPVSGWVYYEPGDRINGGVTLGTTPAECIRFYRDVCRDDLRLGKTPRTGTWHWPEPAEEP